MRMVWLALPNGHQQPRVHELLGKLMMTIEGYGRREAEARPRIDLPGIGIKVVRPQDMPQHVACGHFDLAITGQDWLYDHLCAFPTSPVTEVLPLKLGRVITIGAIVPASLGVSTIEEFRAWASQRSSPFPFIRIASEYVHIADRYAREKQLGRYRVIPIWGKTEAYLPEDADLIIENRERGRTMRAHSLRSIDDFFTSWPCLIANPSSLEDPEKRGRLESLIEAFRQASPPE